MLDPTGRFAGRAAVYDRCRPGYPGSLYRWIVDRFGVPEGARVVEIGSGTGIFSRGLVKHGFAVTAVEPDAGMRRLAEESMADAPGFSSVDGTAEATTLPDRCADLVVAAQAFHWFRRDESRREFSRILVEPGRVALVWNRRLTVGSPFAASFEELLERRCPEYGRIDHRKTADETAIRAFFGHDGIVVERFPNEQRLDWEGLRGRLLSCSYAPMPGTPGHTATFDELRELFSACARDGQVTLDYRTEVFASTLAPTPPPCSG